MASPQLEDGFTRIANELLEALACADISGTQHRVMEMIMRESYGHQRKTVTIGYLALAIKYKIDKAQLIRAMNYLRDRQYLTRERGESDLSTNTWSIQKDYTLWGIKEGSDCLVTSSQLVTSVKESLVAKQSLVTSSQLATTQYKEERKLKENSPTRAREDLPNHPAVTIYREVFDRILNPGQQAEVAGRVTDYDKWRRVCTDWQLNSYKPGNLAGLLDRYEKPDLPPQANTHRSNGYIRAGPAPSEVPGVTEAEAKALGAAVKKEALKGLPDWA